MALLWIGGIVALIVYFAQPYSTIAPEVSEVRFDEEGGTIEIPIYTDAEYSQWHAGTHYSWFQVSKNYSSISIRYKLNDSDKEGPRTGSLFLYCDGRNDTRVSIKIIQEESSLYARGEIVGVKVEHNVREYTSYYEWCNGIKFKITYNARHISEYATCAIWFYHNDGTKMIRSVQCPNYRTASNQVTIQSQVYNTYGDDDVEELFIPYCEFPIEEDIYFEIGLIDHSTDEPRTIAEEIYKDKKFNVTD